MPQADADQFSRSLIPHEILFYPAGRMLSGTENPGHARDRDQADTYRVEPYAVAADIYSEGQLRGPGGLTVYTESADWLYCLAAEGIPGIRVKNRRHFVKRLAFELGWLCGG